MAVVYRHPLFTTGLHKWCLLVIINVEPLERNEIYSGRQHLASCFDFLIIIIRLSQWRIGDYIAKLPKTSTGSSTQVYIAKGNLVQSRGQNVHWLQYQHCPTRSIFARRLRLTLLVLMPRHCPTLSIPASRLRSTLSIPAPRLPTLPILEHQLHLSLPVLAHCHQLGLGSAIPRSPPRTKENDKSVTMRQL